MKYILSRSLPLVVLFIAMASPIFAQSCNPSVPIDGGLSALIAVGAGYGIKKINDNKKKQ